ncbi:hypothetical protein F4777DRAFT_538826 [Nemania sp. FL0916]|nr:hypothetical protein F4777DRAFT_538826 [Nemania sp. FL0916]
MSPSQTQVLDRTLHIRTQVRSQYRIQPMLRLKANGASGLGSAVPHASSPAPSVDLIDYVQNLVDEASGPGGLGPTVPHTSSPVPSVDFIKHVQKLVDEAPVLPADATTSLDFLFESEGERLNEFEKIWLMGLQCGIGLGIRGAREAVLNEMQFENSVFRQPMLQSPASEAHALQRRMEMGRECIAGFDRRVAYRTANQFLLESAQLTQGVVQSGLVKCLPVTGVPLGGTSVFFTPENIARCYENSWRINNEQLITGIQQPDAGSFLGDGFLSLADTGRLFDAQAYVINALQDGHGPGPDGLGVPGQQSGAERPSPVHTTLPVGCTLPPADLQSPVQYLEGRGNAGGGEQMPHNEPEQASRTRKTKDTKAKDTKAKDTKAKDTKTRVTKSGNRPVIGSRVKKSEKSARSTNCLLTGNKKKASSNNHDLPFRSGPSVKE